MSCCVRRERNRRTTPFFSPPPNVYEEPKDFCYPFPMDVLYQCPRPPNSTTSQTIGERLRRLQTPPPRNGSWSGKNLNDDKPLLYRPMCIKFSAPSLLLFYLKPMYPWRGPKFGTFPTAAVHVKQNKKNPNGKKLADKKIPN